jgi:hypothetical protein
MVVDGTDESKLYAEAEGMLRVPHDHCNLVLPQELAMLKRSSVICGWCKR